MSLPDPAIVHVASSSLSLSRDALPGMPTLPMSCEYHGGGSDNCARATPLPMKSIAIKARPIRLFMVISTSCLAEITESRPT